MQAESTWKKEKSILEEDASNISVLKKEIVKIILSRPKRPKSMSACSHPSTKKYKISNRVPPFSQKNYKTRNIKMYTSIHIGLTRNDHQTYER